MSHVFVFFSQFWAALDPSCHSFLFVLLPYPPRIEHKQISHKIKIREPDEETIRKYAQVLNIFERYWTAEAYLEAASYFWQCWKQSQGENCEK